jgi:16S rRNA C967 or C1407 C5-methylase (RsmB/RsmF family)
MELQASHSASTDAELDIMSRLLPRYYRLQPGVGIESLPGDMQDKILPLSWLEGVVAMPGYLKYDERIGASMCASSELAVRALDLYNRNADTSLQVLDLCCCPGMKFNSIVDKLLTTDVVDGVDISPRRMQLCKSIVSKQIMQRRHSPHCRLICADGTVFDGRYHVLDYTTQIIVGILFYIIHLSQGSQMIFDSDIVKDDMLLMKANGRKRQCKRSREREKKHLREIEEQQRSSRSTGGVAIYDRVLVDAECTHDGSYRRVAAMGI